MSELLRVSNVVKEYQNLRLSKVSNEDLKPADLSGAKMPKTSSKLPTAEAVTEEVGSGVSELYQR